MGLEAITVTKDIVKVTRKKTTRRTRITFDGPIQDVVDFAVCIATNVPINVIVDFNEKSAVLFQEWDYKKIKPLLLRKPVNEGPFREGFKPLR